jgi:succinyl-diaminopimelate desuccinylase
MSKINVIDLARQLIQTDTSNPPGKEAPLARILGPILEEAGFRVESHEMEPDRPCLVARIGQEPFLCLTGHMDTVPADPAEWTRDPFEAEIADGRLFGLGSSDMKSGVAAIVAAACGMAAQPIKQGGLVLVLTAAEETGCQGAEFLARKSVLGSAGAMLIAEPSGMTPFVGHKGAMWVKAMARGKAAHGSRPEEGDNAIYKAARAISRIAEFKPSIEPHPILGLPTISVGTIQGGVKTNVVPAKAEFSMDLRLIPGQDPDDVLKELGRTLGPEIEINGWEASEALMSDPSDPWIIEVMEITARLSGRPSQPSGASYFTDGSALSHAMGNPPAVVLGPGSMAHQADEHCLVAEIKLAVQAYEEIMRRWLKL